MHIDLMVPMSGKGGVENVMCAVASYLQEQGYRVRVVEFVYNGIPWLPPEIEFCPLLLNQKVNDISEFLTLYIQFLKQNGAYPDVILASPWPYLSAIAKTALTVFPKPCSVISWMHGPIEEYQKYDLGGIDCLKYADAHLVLNERTKRVILGQLPDAAVEVVNNPVSFEACVYQEHSYLPEKTLVFVGRLSWEKRVDVILKGIAQTKSIWKLIIIGTGDEKEKLEELTEELELGERVTFVGWQERPWDEAKKASALVLASEYEAYPMVAIEALACGIPVVSTPVDGVIELIKPGENGFLFSKDKPEELGAVLDYMASGELPQIDSRTCKESVRRFEWKLALSDFENKLRTLLDNIDKIKQKDTSER